MKRGFLVIGFLVGLVVGWSLGYLRIPYVPTASAFKTGVVSGLACCIAVFLLVNVWNRYLIFARKHKSEGGTRVSLFWPVVTTAIVLGTGMIFLVILSKERSGLHDKVSGLEAMVKDQALAIQQARNNNLVVDRNNLLVRIESELNNSDRRELSNETIDRIAALTKAFVPYRQVKDDSLMQVKLSPERGQLLLTLVNLGMDTASWHAVLRKSTFAYADLRGMDLSGKDLRYIDLRNADLTNARLAGADMRDANLKEANASHALMDHSRLERSDVTRTLFRWSEMNAISMDNVRGEGIDISHAKMHGARLTQAFLQWAFMNGTIISHADLRSADLNYANLFQTDLSGSNLSEASLILIKLQEVNFSSVELVRATVYDSTWIGSLTTSRCMGADYIQTTFRVIQDPTTKYKLRLVRNEK